MNSSQETGDQQVHPRVCIREKLSFCAWTIAQLHRRNRWILPLLDQYCTFSVHVEQFRRREQMPSLGKARVGIAPFMHAASSICAYTLHFFTTRREVFDRCDFIHIDGTHGRAPPFSLFFIRNNPRWTLPALPPWNFQRRDTHRCENNGWILKKERCDRS